MFEKLLTDILNKKQKDSKYSNFGFEYFISLIPAASLCYQYRQRFFNVQLFARASFFDQFRYIGTVNVISVAIGFLPVILDEMLLTWKYTWICFFRTYLSLTLCLVYMHHVTPNYLKLLYESLEVLGIYACVIYLLVEVLIYY